MPPAATIVSILDILGLHVMHRISKSPQKVRQVDNVLIDAGSRIEAGGFRSLVLIEAGDFYLRFYGTQVTIALKIVNGC